MQNKIKYSQCWEDAELLLKALNINKDDRVVSITSGGDNTLSLITNNPSEIYAVDSYNTQNCLMELKLKAIQNLTYKSVLDFFGITKNFPRKQYIEKIKPLLNDNSQQFWENNPNLIEKGILNAGIFEKYFKYFKKYILSLTHSKAKVIKLLNEKESNDQVKFYNNEWDNWRWKLLFRLFFSRKIMSLLGRSAEMFQFAKTLNVSDHYLFKTQKALSKTTVFNNPYLEYIFFGNYFNILPHYLREDSIEKIKNSTSKIEIVTEDILEFLKKFPNRFFTKFNLSDVFEPLSEAKTNLIFEEIKRVCDKNARIIFWNNLVKRDIPNYLKQFFKKEITLEEDLKKEDKVFFYECFNIYKFIG